MINKYNNNNGYTLWQGRIQDFRMGGTGRAPKAQVSRRRRRRGVDVWDVWVPLPYFLPRNGAFCEHSDTIRQFTTKACCN